MNAAIARGDFSTLAGHYRNRPGYSAIIIELLKKHCLVDPTSALVADVGAGTGKLTENLLEAGLRCVAVEPNDAMREEGERTVTGPNVTWRKGSAEETGLADASADWVLMASSFHWTDPKRSLPEFRRILREGGYFTAIWNPRDLAKSEFHMDLERKIAEMIPGMTRVSSGSEKYTAGLDDTLLQSGCFCDVIFVETRYDITMTVDRFVGAWRSVNDIQAQAGPDRWPKVLEMIESHCEGMNEIRVPYKSRAWTARRID